LGKKLFACCCIIIETNILEALTKIVKKYDAINATGMLKNLKIVLLAYFRNKNVNIQKHKRKKLKPEQDFSIRIFKLS
jgi:hypothetical protein